MKNTKGKSYALRIEAHFVEPLQKLKKRNRRSLNAEINAALEDWVSRSGQPAGDRAEVTLNGSEDAAEGAPKRKSPPAKKQSTARGKRDASAVAVEASPSSST
ncbi:MAG: hypothetical protein ACYDAG_01100 [Chloroflexota bacterium]